MKQCFICNFYGYMHYLIEIGHIIYADESYKSTSLHIMKYNILKYENISKNILTQFQTVH